MMEWSGGFFRNFLTRYSESNAMHKRMLEVSDLVHRALKVPAKRQAKALEQPLEVIERFRSEAKLFLQRGQCNCAYWHGVFGGLYLAHLRDAVYRQLIQGDQLAEKLLNENGQAAQEWDQDQDGQNEVVLRSSTWKMYVDPQDGGCVYELDFRPAAANLTNTLTRRPEAYHDRLREAVQSPAMAVADQHEDGPPSIHQLDGVKEAGLAQLLQYDAHRRVSMVDRFLRQEHDVTSFVEGQTDDPNGGLTARFDVSTSRRKSVITAQFTREDRLLRDGYQHPFSLTKSVALDEDAGTVQLSWKLENLGDREYSLRYGTEWNLAVFDPELNAAGSSGAIEQLTLTDQWHQLQVMFEFDRSPELWYDPVTTVSESEGGIEATPQGVCLLFHWIVRLGPRGTWQAKATLSAQTT